MLMNGNQSDGDDSEMVTSLMVMRVIVRSIFSMCSLLFFHSMS